MENPFDEYFSYDPRKDLEAFSTIPTDTWIKLGEQKALENFQIVAKSVPAYKDFLKKHGVSPEKIKTIDDFKQVPLTTKENYFKKYPLKDLVMGGDLSKTSVIYYSSGSMGKSLYWPKSVMNDINTYKGVELLYVYYFDIDKINTLFINCFAMGPWTAGEINHTSVKLMAAKGLKISVVSPAGDTDLFFNVFNDLAGSFEQIVIGGYPSFIKDLVEEGLKRKINFKKHKIKIITGGEKFSENWRRYITKNLGLSDHYRSIISVLGTSETGVTSLSTTFTDYLRIFLSENRPLAKNFFGSNDLPSITQFIPPARYVEIVDKEIVVSCMGHQPLMRYNTKDLGQIFNPADLLSKLPNSFQKEYEPLKKAFPTPNLPILTIFGRSDAVVLGGANIYLDQLHRIVELRALQKYLTGRFLVEKYETEDIDSHLKLTLELRETILPSIKLARTIQDQITNNLVKINSEYKDISKTYGSKVKPIVELKNCGSKEVVNRSGKSIVMNLIK